MAPMVYEGVAGGGDLFQGQKFFIMLRVPARNELVKNVERNGGFVVPLEKNADVLIADHAKPKLAPANSVSWTYLEQSMKKGKLEDLETHRISSPRKTGLPGGPSQPKRLTRTPFTHEESKAISIWVAKAEIMGLPVKGNEIYQQFAERNPQHTPQSWRDHWIKQHSDRPRPDIDMDTTDWPIKSKVDRPRRAIPSTPPSKNVTTSPNASDAGKHPVPADSPLPATSYSPEDEPPLTEETPLITNVPFTDEDIEFLEKEYCDIINLAPETLVYAWEAFATKYGRHPAGDWCNYYHTVFMPRKFRESKENDARATKPKPARGQGSTSKPYTTPVRTTVSSRSPTESRHIASHRKLGRGGDIASSPPESETSKDQSQIGSSVGKAKFLEDLREISNTINREIEPSFSICGRKLELYDLWSVVNKPAFGGYRKVEEANRWLQVALKLEINTYEHKTAHTALKNEYRDKLVNLDAYISARDNGETKVRTSPKKSTEPATPVMAIPTQTVENSHVYSSMRKDGNTKRHTSLTKSTDKSMTAVPTQTPEQAHADSFARKDTKTKGRVSLAKSTNPVTPITATPTRSPGQANNLSSDVSTPKTLRQVTVLPRESANKDTAAERIRQSLGHGAFAFLQSISEFARDCLPHSIIFEPIVSKRKISLFEVWKTSLPLLGHFDDIEGREVWDDVATKLGFEVSAHPSAPDELRQICEDFLLDFYEFFIQREQEKMKEEALRQQSEDQGQSEEEVGGSSDDNLEPPPLAFRTAGPGRQKRSHDQDSISAVVESRPTSSHSHSKRPRISKGKERADEIPSTPEHIYNSHMNDNGKLPGHPSAHNKKLIETNIEYFDPPSPSEHDSSPSRQIESEAKKSYTSHSQNNNDEEETQLQTESQSDEEIKGYTPPSQNNHDEEETQSQTESQSNIETQKFIDRFLAEGFEFKIIQQMLIITIMDAELSERLLYYYANGLEIPKNVAGVWTEEDDNAIKSHVQSGRYNRILEKHGENRCLLRKNFLRALEGYQKD
ncbi:hypothetical protein ACLOAV_004316 [Pseudogymnoascus australis]